MKNILVNRSIGNITSSHSSWLLVLVYLALYLGFVVSTQAQSNDEFSVPPSFTVEGIPAIKNSDVEHLFFDPSQVKSNLIWDVDRKNRSLLVTDERTYIYRLDSPMGTIQNLIDGRSPNMVRVSPKGGVFAFIDDKERKDNYQLYLRDEKGSLRKLSSFLGKDDSVESLVWDDKGERIFYTQTDYESKTTKMCASDLASSTCYDVDLKGIWNVIDFYADKLLLKYWKSSSNQSLYFYDLVSKKLSTVEERGNSTKGFFGEGRVFWISSGSPKCVPAICLMSMDIRTGDKTPVKLPAGVLNLQEVKISPDRKSFLIQEMHDGIDNLRIGSFKNDSIVETVAPFIKGSYVVWHTRWFSNKEVVYTTENISKPASIQIFDISTKRTTAWTNERVPQQFENKVSPPTVIKWKSFDGRGISGYVVKPQKVTGKSPVLIFIHGGPQTIDRPTFDLRDVQFAADLGFTIIHTNIRGSSGFGVDYMDADNGAKRGDAVRDISSILDWIAKQPELDANRVIVRGESYGGFIALASGLREPKRIKAVIAEYPLVSIRGLLSQSWIDEFAIAEYGDPRDEMLMKKLDELSPLNNTGRWNGIPLFITRGKLDSRSPERDVFGLKSQLQDKGTEVWFIYAKEAGHGVGGRYVTGAMYEFLKKQITRGDKQ